MPDDLRYSWYNNNRNQLHNKCNAFDAAAAAKSLQSCLTLCDPRDGSPPGSSVPGILQARTLKWVAISFSNAWKWKVKVKLLSHVWLFTTPWTAAHQAPPSMGFPRQEYWSGVPLPSPGQVPNPMQTVTNESILYMWDIKDTKELVPVTLYDCNLINLLRLTTKRIVRKLYTPVSYFVSHWVEEFPPKMQVYLECVKVTLFGS